MSQNIRPAAVAGQFYAKDRNTLLSDLKACYDRAKNIAPLSKEEETQNEIARAVIVPHAGYVFSGAIAASAFTRINANQHYDHIFLIGPSHHVAFDGASVPTAYNAYQTPLGNVPVDTNICKKLISENRVLSYKPAAHDREHCLEVELPFLQYRMKYMPPIIPIIIGTQDLTTLKKIASALQPYFTDNNLFVISSDFSHYPSYTDAEKVDTNTQQALESGRLNDFISALYRNDSIQIHNLYTSACGQSAISVLLMLAQDKSGNTDNMAPGLKLHHIAYLNSGDSPYGGKSEVVGYHSFVLSEEGKVNKEETNDFRLSENDKKQLLNVAWNAISLSNQHKTVTPTNVFNRKLGAFVTLTKHGRLRGCIGHFGEDIPLVEVVTEMAHAAAFEDPRFQPVREDELKDISIEISVLTPLKRIHDITEFHYGEEGIYMRKGYHSGTFLPQVADEVNWTKEEFLGHCAQDKAGIGWNGWKTAELYTYKALRFSSDDYNK